MSDEEKKNSFQQVGQSGGVNFAQFVVGLAASALYFLGEIPDPETKEPNKDLDQAKHIIDTLVMLEEKTKGNLAQDEEKILTTVLTDLQTKYLKETKYIGGD